MIRYNTRGISFYTKLFRMDGSVFPYAAAMALPPAILAAIIRFFLYHDQDSQSLASLLTNSAGYTGFSGLVFFLLLFRSSHAYARFNEGCQAVFRMRSEWFDACSAIIAFCKHAQVEKTQVDRFQHTLLRLFSMLHAVALAEIEDSNQDDYEEIAAFHYELLDVDGIDQVSLNTIRCCETKLELLFQWIQQLVVEGMLLEVLTIPPPILTRCFQEMANGVVAVNDAIRISSVPFPFPYAQACDALLLIHWLMVPFITSMWLATPWGAFIMAFLQVFAVWCVNHTSVEIESPFGMDANDIDAFGMQQEFNKQLLMLLRPSTLRTPYLSDKAVWTQQEDWEVVLPQKTRSIFDCWQDLHGRSTNHRKGLAIPFGRGRTALRFADIMPSVPVRVSTDSQNFDRVDTTLTTGSLATDHASKVIDPFLGESARPSFPPHKLSGIFRGRVSCLEAKSETKEVAVYRSCRSPRCHGKGSFSSRQRGSNQSNHSNYSGRDSKATSSRHPTYYSSRDSKASSARDPTSSASLTSFSSAPSHKSAIHNTNACATSYDQQRLTLPAYSPEPAAFHDISRPPPPQHMSNAPSDGVHKGANSPQEPATLEVAPSEAGHETRSKSVAFKLDSNRRLS